MSNWNSHDTMSYVKPHIICHNPVILSQCKTYKMNLLETWQNLWDNCVKEDLPKCEPILYDESKNIWIQKYFNFKVSSKDDTERHLSIHLHFSICSPRKSHGDSKINIGVNVTEQAVSHLCQFGVDMIVKWIAVLVWTDLLFFHKGFDFLVANQKVSGVDFCSLINRNFVSRKDLQRFWVNFKLLFLFEQSFSYFVQSQVGSKALLSRRRECSILVSKFKDRSRTNTWVLR